ncbi:hypothetical protein [Clostridium saccharoperbutylacetonicum]|uniref:hypothetical protein n=1 Tax=Clostridium saccharoperbutylacetonicum TaxID=36745 RepID=UPI0039E7D636
MKKLNIIYFLLVTILIVAFLFIFSNFKVQNTNTNTNVINVEEKADKKININTAVKEELMSIDGIGDKKADSIKIDHMKVFGVWKRFISLSNLLKKFKTKLVRKASDN